MIWRASSLVVLLLFASTPAWSQTGAAPPARGWLGALRDVIKVKFDIWEGEKLATVPKPPLPEIVHKYQVLAENALQEKHAFASVYYYQQGLAAYPFWPRGWYNAATIWSELEDWSAAAAYMQWYVRLAPDAPDVRAAKDLAVIWEEKGK